jgi:hypothetical protein
MGWDDYLGADESRSGVTCYSYNERGTAEQWITEGKQATHWTRLPGASARFPSRPVGRLRPGDRARMPMFLVILGLYINTDLEMRV